MIVVRNVFQLKYGKAKEALPLIKEGIAIQKRALTDVEFSTRLLTDLTGPFYTVVLELTIASFGTFETHAPRLFGNKEFQANTEKLVPLVQSGYREVLNIVE